MCVVTPLCALLRAVGRRDQAICRQIPFDDVLTLALAAVGGETRDENADLRCAYFATSLAA